MSAAVAALPVPGERPDPRARLLWTARGYAFELPFAVIAWAAAIVEPGFLPSLLLDHRVAIATVIAALALVLPPVEAAVRLRTHRWELRDDVLLSRTGVVLREWRIVPLARVQTVESGQGPLERAFGLASVTVSTASHAGSSRIEGLAVPVAAALAAAAAERANALREGDGT